MSENKKTHKKTGLIERVLASDHNEKDAENYILNFCLMFVMQILRQCVEIQSVKTEDFYLNQCQIWRNFSL